MYFSKYQKYKSKYLRLKQTGGTIPYHEWPENFYESCNEDTAEDADECAIRLNIAGKNPFYDSDYINTYTNNGFYKGWGGKKTFINTKY